MLVSSFRKSCAGNTLADVGGQTLPLTIEHTFCRIHLGLPGMNCSSDPNAWGDVGWLLVAGAHVLRSAHSLEFRAGDRGFQMPASTGQAPTRELFLFDPRNNSCPCRPHPDTGLTGLNAIDRLPQLWHNAAIKAAMGTSRSVELPASPEKCEPGQRSGSKILPEPQTEIGACRRESRGAGIVLRYQRRGYVCIRLSARYLGNRVVPREPSSRLCVEMRAFYFGQGSLRSASPGRSEAATRTAGR